MNEFIEFDGMVLFNPPLVYAWQTSLSETVQHSKDRAEEQQAPFLRWQYERFHNHQHANMGAPDRDHVRQEVKMAEELATELRAAFPTRNFIVSHIPCYAVSFYQSVDDAPTQSEPLSEYDKETQFCNTCHCQRPYRLLPHPDPEFPQIRWGACFACGDDIALTEDEIRLLVPASATHERQ